MNHESRQGLKAIACKGEMSMTFEEIVKARRSVRRFTDEPVPRETVLELLDLARWAPYASERWRFVVVQDVENTSAPMITVVQNWAREFGE